MLGQEVGIRVPHRHFGVLGSGHRRRQTLSVRIIHARDVIVRVLGIMTLSVWVFGCSSPASVVAENNTGVTLLARVTGTRGTESAPPVSAFETVFRLPPNSRTTLGALGWSGTTHLVWVQVLTPDCQPFATFDDFVQGGSLIVVDAGPTASLKREFPAGGSRGEETTQCAGSASPAP
jgi:hypothetical protein